MSSNQGDSETAVSASVLKAFEPLSALSAQHLEQLAKGASVFNLSRRARLVAADEHRWMVFLLKGEVSLRDATQEIKRVKSSSSSPSQIALFDVTPKPSEAVLSDDSHFVRVDRKQFSVLLSQQIASSTIVDELVLKEFAERQFWRLVEGYEKNSLQVPLRVPVVERFVQLLDQHTPQSNTVLLNILREDPALTLHVFSVVNANSPNHVTTLKGLITQMDRQAVVQHLVRSVGEMPYPAGNSLLKTRLDSVMAYQSRLGALSLALTERLLDLDAEHAEVMGLLGASGVLNVLWMARDELHDELSSQELDEAISALRSISTELLLTRMSVPSMYLGEIEQLHSYRVLVTQNTIELVNVCRAAMDYLPVNLMGQAVNLVEDSVSLAALHRAGISLRDMDQLLEQCDQQMTMGRKSA